MEQHRSLAFLFGGHDPGVCCRMHSGMALWFLGYPESALERSRTGLAMARELSHIGTIVSELPFGGIINQLCGDVVAVREIAEIVDFSLDRTRISAMAGLWKHIERLGPSAEPRRNCTASARHKRIPRGK